MAKFTATPSENHLLCSAASVYDGRIGGRDLDVYERGERLILEIRGRKGALQAQIILDYAEARTLASDILDHTTLAIS